MRIKTINDIIPYLDHFYWMEDFERTDKPANQNKIGTEHKEFYAVAHMHLFRDPEKTLSKLLVSHVMHVIDGEKWLYRKEHDKDTSWTIEWRIRPEYEEPTSYKKFGRIYARFSVYPRVTNEKDKD